MENRMENAAKKAALSIFLSEYPDNAAPDEIIEMVAAQDDRVLFWEPVEDWPGESLADAIRDAAAAILSEWETAAPTQAIAAIREILSADEWSPETLDMIADTVNRIDDNEEFSVTITWLPADVLSLRPNLTADEAEKALRDVAKVLKDRSIEEGWQILDDALFFSGYKND